MKQKLTLKNISISLLIIFVMMQFFRIDKTSPSTSPVLDFINITQAGPEVASILRTSCYDCHSHEVNYPWYTNIAPISWWIRNHVTEGSRHLNFSLWGTYKSRRMDKKLKECVEMIDEDEMPMYSYTLIHKDASLSKEQKELLVNYFNSLRTHESDKPRKD